MRILGIDPGTGITGWGVIDKNYNQLTVVDYGCIRTPSHQLNQKRLCEIYDGMQILLSEYQPDEMAIEELFYNRNVTTVISVGQARGVLVLAAAQRGVPVYEYTPLQIKQAVTGYGRADKKQVQYMIQNLLNLAAIPRPDDAADALAVACCHSNWQQVNHWQKNTEENLV
ncbi:MAG TPA: crossover junction endodeoxyribonuclease RuvC [Candidatus Avidehalobacter gallistercoris]|uniref:Crossover junction endodeoxyribonuclease RuvC n=1 Tax=Candidatus Avidehalobacter gallistercoris TaxID=2840694 RepID=A0A9D1HIP5_9FIRM|nr:crossover junction endodeoxyribonuclease RuvC [Candidatus Avidehalobacter gallistercoris]